MIEIISNTFTDIELVCIDNLTDEPIELSNKDVNIMWRQNRIVNTRQMQIIDSLSGLVGYRFQDNELYIGTVEFDIIITDMTSTERITNKNVVRIIVK